MVAFQYRMPAGIPGNVGRIEAATIEAQIVNTTTPPTRFGDPVALTTAGNGGVRPLTTGDVAADVYGFLMRPYPTQGSGANVWPSDPLNNTAGYAGAPALFGICNILRRGYISVMLNGAAASVSGGQVYVRVAAAAAGKPIGGIEAAADGVNTILLSNCEFRGAADALGNTEIAVFIGPQY